MKGVIQEIVAPERLVFTNIAVDAAGKHLLEGLTTVIFADERGKTKMTLHTHAAAVAEVGNRLSARHGDGLDAEHRQARGLCGGPFSAAAAGIPRLSVSRYYAPGGSLTIVG